MDKQENEHSLEVLTDLKLKIAACDSAVSTDQNGPSHLKSDVVAEKPEEHSIQNTKTVQQSMSPTITVASDCDVSTDQNGPSHPKSDVVAEKPEEHSIQNSKTMQQNMSPNITAATDSDVSTDQNGPNPKSEVTAEKPEHSIQNTKTVQQNMSPKITAASDSDVSTDQNGPSHPKSEMLAEKPEEHSIQNIKRVQQNMSPKFRHLNVSKTTNTSNIDIGHSHDKNLVDNTSKLTHLNLDKIDEPSTNTIQNVKEIVETGMLPMIIGCDGVVSETENIPVQVTHSNHRDYVNDVSESSINAVNQDNSTDAQNVINSSNNVSSNMSQIKLEKLDESGIQNIETMQKKLPPKVINFNNPVENKNASISNIQNNSDNINDVSNNVKIIQTSPNHYQIISKRGEIKLEKLVECNTQTTETAQIPQQKYTYRITHLKSAEIKNTAIIDGHNSNHKGHVNVSASCTIKEKQNRSSNSENIGSPKVSQLGNLPTPKSVTEASSHNVNVVSNDVQNISTPPNKVPSKASKIKLEKLDECNIQTTKTVQKPCQNHMLQITHTNADNKNTSVIDSRNSIHKSLDNVRASSRVIIKQNSSRNLQNTGSQKVSRSSNLPTPKSTRTTFEAARKPSLNKVPNSSHSRPEDFIQFDGAAFLNTQIHTNIALRSILKDIVTLKREYDASDENVIDKEIERMRSKHNLPSLKTVDSFVSTTEDSDSAQDSCDEINSFNNCRTSETHGKDSGLDNDSQESGRVTIWDKNSPASPASSSPPECTTCFKNFKSAESLRQHLKRSCPGDCTQLYKKRNEAGSSASRVKGSVVTEEESSKNNSETDFTDLRIDKVYSAGEQIFRCLNSSCKFLGTTQALHRHMKHYHKELFRRMCTTCNIVFPSNTSWETHCITTGHIHYFCSNCSFITSDESENNAHCCQTPTKRPKILDESESSSVEIIEIDDD